VPLDGWWHHEPMAPIRGAVVRAAVGFGLEPERLRPLGGRSGSAWSDGDVVLRVGERVAQEVLAVSAAAGHLPVPRVLGRVELDGVGAVLLERLPGRAAGELALDSPGRAAAVGRACGELHDALAEVACPPGLREVPGASCTERRLLHLDLHPSNVLVDDDGEPTGVIDWANAAAGDPELDRARTWSLLTLDPAARERNGDPGWAALTDQSPGRAPARPLGIGSDLGLQIHACGPRGATYIGGAGAHPTRGAARRHTEHGPALSRRDRPPASTRTVKLPRRAPWPAVPCDPCLRARGCRGTGRRRLRE
jgi:hypothetical protein